MTKCVGYSQYWDTWCSKVVTSGIRKSKSEIVEEGLKRIKDTLDAGMMELDEARERIKEEKEAEEEDEAD